MILGWPARWSAGLRRLHWVTAALIAALFALGWVMTAVPLSLLLVKFVLYQAHKSFGLIVPILVVWRLALRWRWPAPALETPAWRHRMARTVQALLYLLLLIMPATGFLSAAAAPAGIPTLFLGFLPIPHPIAPDPVLFARLQSAHRIEGWLLLALLGLHIGGAWSYQRFGRK